MLAWVGRLLIAESRGIDTVARVGGEEFVALLPDTDLAGAGEFTERVRAALDRHETQELPPLAVSAGVVCGHAGGDLQTMLRRADSALYAAKRAGAIGRCSGRRRSERTRHRPTTGSPPRS